MRLSKVLYLLLGLGIIETPTLIASTLEEPSPLENHASARLPARALAMAEWAKIDPSSIDVVTQERMKEAFYASQGSFDIFCKLFFTPPAPSPVSLSPAESAEEAISHTTSPPSVEATKKHNHKESERNYRIKTTQVVAYMKELAQHNSQIKALLHPTQSLTSSQIQGFNDELQEIKKKTQERPHQDKKIHALQAQKSRQKKNVTGVVALYWALVQQERIPPFDVYYAHDIATNKKMAVGDFGGKTHKNQFHPYS
jgi:hypothetical protein